MSNQTDGELRDYLTTIDNVFRQLLPKPPSWDEPYLQFTEAYIREARWLQEQIRIALEPDFPDECLLWPYRKTTMSKGYLLGRRWIRRFDKFYLWVTRHPLPAVAWEFAFCEVPKGKVAYQDCGNGLCFHPSHLRLRDSLSSRKQKWQWNYWWG